MSDLHDERFEPTRDDLDALGEWPPTRIGKLRQIRERHQAATIDGFWVDATTASALIAVHDALKPENQARFDSIPLPRLVDFAWKHVTPGA